MNQKQRPFLLVKEGQKQVISSPVSLCHSDCISHCVTFPEIRALRLFSRLFLSPQCVAMKRVAAAKANHQLTNCSQRDLLQAPVKINSDQGAALFGFFLFSAFAHFDPADFPAVFFIFVALIFVTKHNHSTDKYKYKIVKIRVSSVGQSILLT